jgi:hypothetical protein
MESVRLYQYLLFFLRHARDDARISAVHISLYTALIVYCENNERVHPFTVFSAELMPLCKISGTATYHRCIRELHEYGYIRYTPSYNHFLGSLVCLEKG